MKNICINSLMGSFRELEQAVLNAKRIIAQRQDTPEYVLERLDEYQSILTKQRGLALDLCASVATKDWQNATRRLRLINTLSTMIRDDATDLIQRYRMPHIAPVENLARIAN